jgi:hypothetical protein
MTDARRSGSAGATSDDVNGKDGTVEATRPVASSAYAGNRSNRNARRPTPWPLPNPDAVSTGRGPMRHKASMATQSSEEGEAFEPLPAARKYVSKLAKGKAPRNAERVRVPVPKPVPQGRLSGPSSSLDVRPDAEMMDSLAARVGPEDTRPLGDADIAGSADIEDGGSLKVHRDPESVGRLATRAGSTATQSSADDDTVPPLPPRSPLRVSWAAGTNTQPPSSDKQKESRFDSLGPKLSNEGTGSPGPAPPASDGSEDVSDGSRESATSNPGQKVLNMLGHLTKSSGKRPSVSGRQSTSQSQARARDGSRPTTGTDEVNTGKSALDVLNMYRGNPARRSSRHSVTAIPKAPNDLGVLPESYAEDDGSPGPSSRLKTSHPAGIEEEEEEEELYDDYDDERSPTDTRAPQLPLPEAVSPLSLRTLRRTHPALRSSLTDGSG